MRVVLPVGSLLAGLLTGVAGVVLHQYPWGLALAVVASAAGAWWLPPRWSTRPPFAVGWVIAVGAGTVTRPEGDYLVPADTSGVLLLVWSFALLLAALATARRRPGGAADQGVPPGRT